jgi:hypothetical protein
MDMKLKYAMDTLNIFFSCIVYDLLKLQTTLLIFYMTLQDTNEHVSVSLSSGFILQLPYYVCVWYRMDNDCVRDTDTYEYMLLKYLWYF